MSLEQLLQQPSIWRGNESAARARAILPAGMDALTSWLPGGGWPVGSVVEILSDSQGVGELRLIAPALARLSRLNWHDQGSEGEDEHRDTAAGGLHFLAWISPPYIPYAPGMELLGLQPEHALWVQPRSLDDAWWAAEQSLQSGVCPAVLIWPDSDGFRDPGVRAADREVRRLQIAAESSRSVGFVFRKTNAARQFSPAALRLLVRPHAQGLQLRVIKARGRLPSTPLVL